MGDDPAYKSYQTIAAAIFSNSAYETSALYLENVQISGDSIESTTVGTASALINCANGRLTLKNCEISNILLYGSVSGSTVTPVSLLVLNLESKKFVSKKTASRITNVVK